MPITMKAIRIEKATLISTTSGMPLAPVAASTRPFSSDMKPTTWLTALRRVTIISRPSSTTDEREGEILARQRIGVGGHPQHHHHRERDQAHAEQHGRADADHVLDLAVDAEPHDDPVQRDRDDDGLEHQRDRRGDVEVRRILDIGLPGDRQRQHQRMQREDVEQRVEPVLVELHEAHQHQRAGQHMRDVEGEAAHQRLRETNSRSVASRPSISAAPRNSGTRNTRILAIEVSNSASRKPPTASLPR